MNRKAIAASILALWASFAGAAGQPSPKWEVGAGLGVLSIADYRGSKEYRTRVLPIPYLIYRSRLLRVDRQGVRGLLFTSDRLELNMSLNASLTSHTDDNPLRQGMPELDPTFEIGPSLDIRLTDDPPGHGWLLRLPIRDVVAFSGDGLDSIGWLFNPNVYWQGHTNRGWEVGYSAGLYFADQDYHDYYYSVAPAYATTARPAFRAQRGFSGFSTQLSVSRHAGNMWVGAYLRYDNLGGTELLDSPLVETEHYIAAGIGISWIFASSKTGSLY